MTAYAWGNNGHGQLGLGHTGRAVLTPTPVTVLDSYDWVSLHGQYFSTLVLLHDATSLGYGGKGMCQLVDGKGGVREETPVPIPAPTLYKPARQLACRGSHSVAVLLDGTCEAGGANGYGTRGDGTREPGHLEVANDPAPSKVALPDDALGHVIAAAAGNYGCSALLDDGRVLSWGEGNAGGNGDGTILDRLTPVYTRIAGVRAIARGWNHALAILENGQVAAWGANHNGQCANPAFNVTTPAIVHLPAPAIAVAAAGALSLALLENGDLYQWGRLLKEVTSRTPRLVLSNVTAVDAGCYETNSTVLAVAAGEVHGWGVNDYGQADGATRTTRLAPVAVALQASAVSCGDVDSRAW